MHPAKDTASAREHFYYTIRTASAAAIEWVSLVETDASAQQAIEFAKTWNAAHDEHVTDDLEDGLDFARSGSCVLQKYDGAHAPKEIAQDCTPGKILTHPHIPKHTKILCGSFTEQYS